MPLAVLSGALEKFQKALVAASGLAMPISRTSRHAPPRLRQPAFPRRVAQPAFSSPFLSPTLHSLALFSAVPCWRWGVSSLLCLWLGRVARGDPSASAACTVTLRVGLGSRDGGYSRVSIRPA